MPTPSNPPALRKAAALLRSLDGEAASALFARLSADEARALRDAVRDVGDVAEEDRLAVADALRAPAAERASSAGVELAIRADLGELLSAADAAPPQPREEPVSIASPSTTWLTDADPSVLASLLRLEQPQTIAAALSCLPPPRAAGVLAALPVERRPAVLDRLAGLGDADPGTLEVIASGLREWIVEHQSRQALRTRRLGAVEAILAATNEDDRADLLAAVEDRPWRWSLSDRMPSSSAASRVNRNGPDERPAATASPVAEEGVAAALPSERDPGPPPAKVDAAAPTLPEPTRAPEPEPPQLVSFADVERFPASALAQVLRHAPADHLLLALAGGSERLTQKIASALPRRQAAALRRRLAQIGPVRLRDIELAQQSVARVASELLRRGWVSLRPAAR